MVTPEAPRSVISKGNPTPEGEVRERLIDLPEHTLGRSRISSMARLNPGIDIINPRLLDVNFGKNGEDFDPGQFELPRVAWVQTGLDRKEFLIIDGHHRAHIVDAHLEEIQEKFPGFEFRVKNVTQFYINKFRRKNDSPSDFELPESLVVNATKDQDPPALTLEEYLDALVGPTAAQPEVASLRVAVTLMKAWSGMLDSEELARKYSALSAFEQLEDLESLKELKGRDIDYKVKEAINSIPQFFDDAEIAETQKIKEELFRYYKIIKRAKVKAKQVNQAAVIVVSSKAEAVGGREEIVRQVGAQMHSKGLREKFEAYGPGVERENKMAEVASEIVTEFESRAPSKEVTAKSIGLLELTRFKQSIFKALKHPYISLDEFRALLHMRGNSEHVELAYKEFLYRNYTAVLRDKYIKRHQILLGPDEEYILTHEEQAVIDKYAKGFADYGLQTREVDDKHMRPIFSFGAKAKNEIPRARAVLAGIDASPLSPKEKAAVGKNLRVHLDRWKSTHEYGLERYFDDLEPTTIAAQLDLIEALDKENDEESPLIQAFSRTRALLAEIPPGQIPSDAKAAAVDIYVAVGGTMGATQSDRGVDKDEVASLRDKVSSLTQELGVAHNETAALRTALDQEKARADTAKTAVGKERARADAAEKAVGKERARADAAEKAMDQVYPELTALRTVVGAGVKLENTVAVDNLPPAEEETGVSLNIHDIDAKAKTFYRNTKIPWEIVRDKIQVGEHRGLEAISATLQGRLETVLDEARDHNTNPLTLDSHEIEVLIGQHYAKLLHPHMERGAYTAYTSMLRSDLTKSRILQDYGNVLQLLLYTDPSDVYHKKALAFLKTKDRAKSVASKLVASYKERTGIHPGQLAGKLFAEEEIPIVLPTEEPTNETH